MRFLIGSSAVVLLALTSCDRPPPQAEPEQAENAAPVRSSGIVVAVTREYDAVTIQHEPIPEYGMDAMTMEFTVADGAQLESIAPGDHVSFELSGPIDIRTITESPSN